jgi:hypothetical protein
VVDPGFARDIHEDLTDARPLADVSTQIVVAVDHT